MFHVNSVKYPPMRLLLERNPHPFPSHFPRVKRILFDLQRVSSSHVPWAAVVKRVYSGRGLCIDLLSPLNNCNNLSCIYFIFDVLLKMFV